MQFLNKLLNVLKFMQFSKKLRRILINYIYWMHLTLLCENEYTEHMYPINALLTYFVFRLSQNTTYTIRERKLSRKKKTSHSLFWRKKSIHSTINVKAAIYEH